MIDPDEGDHSARVGNSTRAKLTRQPQHRRKATLQEKAARNRARRLCARGGGIAGSDPRLGSTQDWHEKYEKEFAISCARTPRIHHSCRVPRRYQRPGLHDIKYEFHRGCRREVIDMAGAPRDSAPRKNTSSAMRGRNSAPSDRSSLPSSWTWRRRRSDFPVARRMFGRPTSSPEPIWVRAK